jgi:hypothetical protein
MVSSCELLREGKYAPSGVFGARFRQRFSPLVLPPGVDCCELGPRVPTFGRAQVETPARGKMNCVKAT